MRSASPKKDRRPLRQRIVVGKFKSFVIFVAVTALVVAAASAYPQSRWESPVFLVACLWFFENWLMAADLSPKRPSALKKAFVKMKSHLPHLSAGPLRPGAGSERAVSRLDDMTRNKIAESLESLAAQTVWNDAVWQQCYDLVIANADEELLAEIAHELIQYTSRPWFRKEPRPRDIQRYSLEFRDMAHAVRTGMSLGDFQKKYPYMTYTFSLWGGKGYWVFVVVFGCSLIANLMFDAEVGPGYYDHHKWPFALSLLPSAAICWALGNYLRKRSDRVVINKQTGRVFVINEPRHTFFSIPMQWWGLILWAGGLILFAIDFPG